MPRSRVLAAGVLTVVLLAVVALVVVPRGGGTGAGLAARSSASAPESQRAVVPDRSSTSSTSSTSTTSAASTTSSSALAAAAAGGPAGRPLAGRTVAVDPGHNGRNATAPAVVNRLVDAGGFGKACNSTGTATDGGISESSVAWAVALQVRARLQALGATVVLTRQDDRGVGPCIDERAAVANRAKADLLLSIHVDGAPATATGFHVIRPGVIAGYTDDIAGPSSTLAVAVRDALVSGGLRVSTYAGQDGLVTRTDLGTLNRSDVPACMVELGNLRNPAEAATLTSPAGQGRAAAALASGAEAWLRRPPAERSGPPPSGSSPPGTAEG